MTVKTDSQLGGDGLARYENTIEIRAPPEKVWEMLALDRWPEWMGPAELISAKYTSEVVTPEDKYKVGASAHMVEKRWEYELVITESVKNERLSARSKGKFTYNATSTLKPVGEGTLLTGTVEYVLDSFFARAIDRLLKGAAQKQMDKASALLKELVEKQMSQA